MRAGEGRKGRIEKRGEESREEEERKGTEEGRGEAAASC